MTTRIDEVADGIYRISTHVAAMGPQGFCFCQFLVTAEEPLLFHCGHRKMFPAISEAVARVMPIDKLRWVSFSHVEADECGALEAWLDAAPRATATHTAIGCRIWINDLTDRVRPLRDGEVLDLGGKRVRHLSTPHLPHGWDAGLIYEETTGTLFPSDLFAQGGNGPAVTTESPVAAGIAAEEASQAMSLTAQTAPTLRRLAALHPKKLALMHGSTYEGDVAAALEALAAHCASKLDGPVQ